MWPSPCRTPRARVGAHEGGEGGAATAMRIFSRDRRSAAKLVAASVRAQQRRLVVGALASTSTACSRAAHAMHSCPPADRPPLTPGCQVQAPVAKTRARDTQVEAEREPSPPCHLRRRGRRRARWTPRRNFESACRPARFARAARRQGRGDRRAQAARRARRGSRTRSEAKPKTSAEIPRSSGASPSEASTISSRRASADARQMRMPRRPRGLVDARRAGRARRAAGGFGRPRRAAPARRPAEIARLRRRRVVCRVRDGAARRRLAVRDGARLGGVGGAGRRGRRAGAAAARAVGGRRAGVPARAARARPEIARRARAAHLRAAAAAAAAN